MSSEPLITKFRPISFDEVLGNELCIKSLREALRSESRPHAFLFSGPSGVGKTTLARIIGKELDAFIQQTNAATNSGVEDTRKMAEAAQYKSVMGQPTKLLIIDEAHNLSQK